MTAVHEPAGFDPATDLTLNRFIDAPVELVWTAWTTPEHLKQWWTPRPWTTLEVEMDLSPGGIFKTVMQSPQDELFPYTGCFLKISPLRRIVSTNQMGPGFRPLIGPIPFTAIFSFDAEGKGTRYSAHVMHPDEDGRKRHEDMGFQEGWAICMAQLAEFTASLKAGIQ